MFLLQLFFKSVEQQLEISLITAKESEQEKEGNFPQVCFFFFNQATGKSIHALKFLFSHRFSSCIVDNVWLEQWNMYFLDKLDFSFN